MKNFLNDVIKPNNREQLVQGINDYRNNHLKIEDIVTKINHLDNILKSIVILKGSATGY